MKFRLISTFILLLILFTSSCKNKLQNGLYYENVGNFKLNYSIKGEGPVMIVGHLNSGKIGYELTLQPLEKHFTMVYYEPRGTGLSQTPLKLEEYNQEYIVQEIDDLRKILKTDKIWIFGHSDQSAVALEYALKFPQNTAGLILSGTSLVGSQEESIERRKISELKRAKESEWFSQVLKDWDYMNANNTKTNEKGKDVSTAKIKWWCYNEETAQKVLPIVEQINKIGRRKPINGEFAIESVAEREKYLNFQKSFPEIKAKTLIINGKYDTNNPPKYAIELQKVLPNSKLVLVEKAGHFPWIENPKDTFSEIENWLKFNKN